MKKTSNMEQKKTREELIRQCRYYKGEEECLSDDAYRFLFWNHERTWVKGIYADPSAFSKVVEDYNIYLRDFSKDDGVPTSLKAVLLNRYGHQISADWKYISNTFKDYYINHYLKG